MVKVSNVTSSGESKSDEDNGILKTKDELGRQIVLKKPSYIRALNFIKALGKLAENSVYYESVYPVSWVQSVDGHEILFPASLSEVEAIAQRLDYAGMNAIIDKIYTTQKKKESDQDAENIAEDTYAAAKK